MRKVMILTVFIYLVLAGCGKEKLQPAHYAAYVSDEQHGLVQKTSAGGFDLALYYLPLDLQVINGLGKNEVNEKEYQEMKEAYAGQLYFKLKISGRQTPIEEQLKRNVALQDLLKFEGSKKMQLRIGNKTYPVSIYHAEVGMQLSPYITLLFSFELREEEIHDDLSISIQASTCFNVSEILFRYKKENIQNLPELKTN